MFVTIMEWNSYLFQIMYLHTQRNNNSIFVGEEKLVLNTTYLCLEVDLEHYTYIP